MRRQAKVGDTVKVQLSNGPLVQAYGQYGSLYEIYKDLFLEGKVVRVSAGGRISVQFKARIIRELDSGTGNTVQNGFGKGAYGYCLYFEEFSKFPYEVLGNEPKEIDQATLDALERFKQQTWQLVESDYFANESKVLRNQLKTARYAQAYGMNIQNLPVYPASLRDYYVAGVDPYQSAENINMQFVEPLLGTNMETWKDAATAYGSTWINSRRVGQNSLQESMRQIQQDLRSPVTLDTIKDISDAFRVDGRENVFGALEYAKATGDHVVYPDPLPFLTKVQQQLLLLCP